jgi:AraC-like DNA-binding protein/PAS domain-containing protein
LLSAFGPRRFERRSRHDVGRQRNRTLGNVRRRRIRHTSSISWVSCTKSVDGTSGSYHGAMHESLAPHVAAAVLFDATAGMLYCVKDAEGRYVAMNQAFVSRTRNRERTAVLGQHAHDLFPADLAARYEAQDEQLRADRVALVDELELITEADGSLGWYLTGKLPVIDAHGEFAGSVVVSTELGMRAGSAEADGLASVVHHVAHHLDEPHTVTSLATVAGLTPSQLERRMQKVFGLAPKQYVVKARVDEACRLLTHTNDSLATIANTCGWYDQSAFTRQFTRITGCPPGEFRSRNRG